MFRIYCVSILFLLFVLKASCTSPTIRQIVNGPIEGIELTSTLGQTYYAFKGIPYAEPPVTGTDPYTGEQVDRRFKAPEPLKIKWTGLLRVHKHGDICVPSLDSELASSENCLVLNVYVPAGGAAKKTVLVYIHGGGFAFGDSSISRCGPDFLLSADNVVVTLQYRLGIFGFLNFGEYTGNMGLKDQQLAIIWVYENIEHFSGNKNEILLFGQSAGGASVHFHMLNEESRKYFSRAFLISSSAFSHYALRESNHMGTIQKCFNIYDKMELINYLKTAKSSVLAECSPAPIGKELSLTWVPTIESDNVIAAFLTKTPDEIYRLNNAPIMDTMFSFTAQEFITMPFLPDLHTEPILKSNWIEPHVQLPFKDSRETLDPEVKNKIIEKLRNAYFSDTSSVDAIQRSNVALMTDLTFADSILKAVILQANTNGKAGGKTGGQNTFYYRFSSKSAFRPLRELFNASLEGSGHSDDMCYIFHCHKLNPKYDIHLKHKDENYDLIMRMVKMITNFAKTGNPSIEGDTPFENCKSETQIFCQDISNESKSSVISNIKERLHYDTWREIEEILLKSIAKTMAKPHELKEEL